jgi:ABC-type polysaccharide/polyol phosphate export permease
VNLAIPTLLAHGPLLQKVYFPSYAPIVGSMGGVLVQTMIEFAILGVVLILVGNVGVSWLMFPMWMLIFVTFVTSLAVALAIMNVYFRDLAHITSVALGLLFFLTPIIYPINLVPEEWNGIPLRAIVAFNPISEFVESLRLLLYGIAIPPWPVWLGLVAWMLGALALAAFTYRRWGLDIGESV